MIIDLNEGYSQMLNTLNELFSKNSLNLAAVYMGNGENNWSNDEITEETKWYNSVIVEDDEYTYMNIYSDGYDFNGDEDARANLEKMLGNDFIRMLEIVEKYTGENKGR